MIRALSAAAIVFALAASAAHANEAQAGELKLSYHSERLATDAGRERLKTEAVEAVDAYCRAHPVLGTVAACRAAMVADANRQIEVNAHAYAERKSGVRLTKSRPQTLAQQNR